MRHSLILTLLSLVVLLFAIVPSEAGLFRRRCQQGCWISITPYVCALGETHVTEQGEPKANGVCQQTLFEYTPKGKTGRDYGYFYGIDATVPQARDCAFECVEELAEPNTEITQHGPWFTCTTDPPPSDIHGKNCLRGRLPRRSQRRYECMIEMRAGGNSMRFIAVGCSPRAARCNAVARGKNAFCTVFQMPARCYRVVECKIRCD